MVISLDFKGDTSDCNQSSFITITIGRDTFGKQLMPVLVVFLTRKPSVTFIFAFTLSHQTEF